MGEKREREGGMEEEKVGRREGDIRYLKRAHKLKKNVSREYLARR